MIRRIPIRLKVAGALALPLCALLIGAGAVAAEAGRRADRITRQADVTTASIGHAGLINALLSERNIAGLEMIGLEGAVGVDLDSSERARRATDAAVERLVQRIDGGGDVLRDDYARALLALEALVDLRADADVGRASPGLHNRKAAHDVFTGYSDVVDSVFAAHDRFSAVVDTTELRQGGELVHHASRATDAVARLAELLLYVGTGPGSLDDPDELVEIAELRRDVDRDNAVLRARGTGAYARATQRLFADDRLARLDRVVDDVVAGEVPIDSEALLATVPLGPGAAYSDYSDEVAAILDETTAERSASAQAERRASAGAGVAVLAGAVAAAYLASRSITRPLRELSRQARTVAGEHLPRAVAAVRDTPVDHDLAVPAPQAVVVRSTDEVGDVADALNEVQVAAIELAVEQAALRRTVAASFVSLGRRNQNLLRRLLGAIGELEDAEHDATALERLYRLDHLATRMRRNAESLLVLADAPPAPRTTGAARVPDVVRTALGAVEGYDRVRFRSIDEAVVLGGAAEDLAHLLAELIENALRHSPPSEPVEIGGSALGAGYTLVVVDHGLGMAPDDIAAANRRLGGQPSFLADPSKDLGHLVTAALARRHGIGVELSATGAAGVTATVRVPGGLVADVPPRHAAAGLPPAAARTLVEGLVDDPGPVRLEPLFAGAFDRHAAPEGT